VVDGADSLGAGVESGAAAVSSSFCPQAARVSANMEARNRLLIMILNSV